VRIALVHTRYRQRGGEEVAFEAEAQLLASRGHDVHVIATDNNELDGMLPVRTGMLTVWNEGRRQQIAEQLRAIEPDIVHFHNTFPLLSPAVCYAVPRRAAAVQTLHNYRLVCPAATLMRGAEPCEACVGHTPVAAIRHGCYRGSRLASAAVAAMLQLHRMAGTWTDHVDAFIALTAFARRVFVRGGLPADRLYVKPNFIDPDPGIGAHDRANYLFVGRLDQEKGVRVLVEAFSRARLPLNIIGAGPLEPDVRAAAAAADNITYLGAQPRERVLAEMRAARALVIPSVCYESFPFVVVEALATGLPVISSDLPNLRALVAERGAGWSFRTGDAVDLARVVQIVDASVDERHDNSLAARQLYEAEYTGSVNGGHLERIYKAAKRRRQAQLA